MLAFRTTTLRASARCIVTRQCRGVQAVAQRGRRLYSETASQPAASPSSQAVFNELDKASSAAESVDEPLATFLKELGIEDDPVNGKVTETKKSPGKFRDPLPLVPLPVRPTDWPTPWLSQADFSTYVAQLYERNWGVKFLPRKPGQPRTLCLTGTFKLASWKESIKFMEDVNYLSGVEKHNPVKFSIHAGPKFTDIEVLIQTHSAYRPANFGRRDPSEHIPKVYVAGITTRDIRMAILLDRIYRKRHLPRSKLSAKFITQEQASTDAASAVAEPAPSSSADTAAEVTAEEDTRPILLDPRGPTPKGYRPGWGQVAWGMVRCDGQVPENPNDWVLAYTLSKSKLKKKLQQNNTASEASVHAEAPPPAA